MLGEMPVQGVRDRVFFLRSLASFAPLDEESIGLLADHARPRSFRAGESLICDTRPMASVFMLVSGKVRVTYQGELVSISERPRGVGLLAVRAGKSCGTGAVALTDTTALELPVEAMRTVYEENFAVTRNDLRLCAGELLGRYGNLPVASDLGRALDEGVWRDRPRTLVERVLETRKESPYTNVNLDAVIDLTRRGHDVRYAPGDRIWTAGDASDFYVRIDAGRVRCSTAEGKSVDVGAGQVLGSLDAFAMKPRAFEATAQSPVMGYRTSLEAMLSVMETQHELARGLLARLATALLDLQLAGHRAARVEPTTGRRMGR